LSQEGKITQSLVLGAVPGLEANKAGATIVLDQTPDDEKNAEQAGGVYRKIIVFLSFLATCCTEYSRVPERHLNRHLPHRNRSSPSWSVICGSGVVITK
jgi:hypothetical protein